MSQVTLEKLEKKQNELAELIAKFKTETTTAFIFPSTEIELAHGENYAGLILGKNGEQSYHLVLCAGSAESLNWKDAKAWVAKQGTELPTRREQSLLYANLKEEFEEAAYWSCAQHAANADCAWYQTFNDGNQHYYYKDNTMRVRAVRRVVI